MGVVYYKDNLYGGGASDWGDIGGTLSDQTDLQNALNAKQDELTQGNGIDISGTTIALDISYLTASRLGVIPSTEKGTNSGVATLNENGKVPESQLPSYVDDVIEGYYKEADGKFYEDSAYTTEIVGERGKIYISVDTDKSYRWSGSVFVEISSGTVVWGSIDGTLANQTDLKNALDAKQDNLTFDTTPTTNSTNPVTSGGIKTVIDTKPTAVELTQAEYDALTLAEKTDTTKIYYVTDNNVSGSIVTFSEVTGTDTVMGGQVLTIDGVSHFINGTRYMEKTQTLSTSANNVFTFTNNNITANSAIEPFSSIFDIDVKSIDTSTPGQCVVTYEPYSSAVDMLCKIYIR